MSTQLKRAKSSVSYQDKPKGNAYCEDCKYWRAPAGCALVHGTISSKGWCKLFDPKKEQ